MNKTFKTLWNDVRRCYIVANEAQKTHGKPSKAAVVAVAVMGAFGVASASAAYVDPGVVAQNSSQVQQAKQTWETAEYNKNWGLTAQKASSAYALGYHGQGVKVGQMDSGILKGHVELSGDRWHAVHASGEYTHDGERYPQYGYPDREADTGKYHAGDKFDLDGYYNSEYNDGHGTSCAGVYAGNRDGQGMHGVAWGSEFYSANTGGTDDSNYGPFPDYGFFKAGYDALVDAGVKIINNSWGTNLKQVDENGNILDYDHSGPELTTTNDIEYEYFMFKQNYNGGPSFVDAAWDAVKGKDVIQAFSAGNNDRANPYHRGLFPYFNPEAEKQWLVVSGLEEAGGGNYKLEEMFNEAGYAKYWTMTAPGQNGYSSKVWGEDAYGESAGTSMATPFVSGAFAVIASRYTDMTAVQAREVMLTTAHHRNPDGSIIDGWANADGTMPAEGEVSDRMGWGVPDLEKGMYGPGQFFNGNFDYNMKTVKLDVWSNDISQVALDQRAREDIAWLKSVTEDGTIDGKVVVSDNPDDYKLTNTSNGSANADGQDHNYDLAGVDNKNVTLEDAMKWRLEYYEKRAQSIRDKIANGEYDGSLTKRGAGTLVMTGNNTYRGGTTVEEGTLLGFAESFGVTDDDASATANGKVTVNGGVFGIMNSYNDQFTMKGEINSNPEAGHSVDITVNKGGTYGVVAGQDVTVGSLTFADGAGITVVSLGGDVLADALKNDAGVTGSVTADHLEGVTDTNPVVDPDYAFFDTEIKLTEEGEGGRIDATLSRNDATAATYAATSGQAAMGNALMANQDGQVFAEMAGATKGQIRNTLASLSNDFHLAAQNATIVNTALMGRMIKDQANAYGEAQRAELENGATLWAAGMGSWGDVDAGGASVNMDVDYYAGFIGAELPYGNGNKVGVFFGYGQTDFDAGNDGDMDSDDIHIGMYGENDWEKFGLTYGFSYTTQDREGKQSLNFLDQVTHNAIDYNATVFQIFGEASYKGFNTESYQVEPYIGLSWLNVSADDFTQRAGNHSVKTEIDDQNLGLANIGVRGALPFTAGSVAMKVRADVGYMQFFGDKEATAKVTVGDAGTASITGEELSGMGMVGIGLDAAIGKNATFGVNYTGAFGSDITSHGIGAKLGIKF